MKYGVREICDVVFKAKKNMTIGNKKFFKDEPVIYFDSLKTSTLEGAASTVYAQGGKGNPRLVAWEGDRTVTFTMEDALISPAGIMILSGAGLIEASSDKKIYVHAMEQTDAVTVNKGEDGEPTSVVITLKQPAHLDEDRGNLCYVMILDDDGEINTEPYCVGITANEKTITIPAANNDLTKFTNRCVVLVDYYVEKTSGVKQIEIEAGKFGGNYYVEASTLFRDTDGIDYPAEFVIPNAKVQSNFSFAMAASGDPSTFTFTMDAFPDYTRFDNTKKVLAIVQIIEEADEGDSSERAATAHDYEG